MCIIPTKPKYLCNSVQYELSTPLTTTKSTLNQSFNSSKKPIQLLPKIPKKNLTKVANVTKYFVNSNDFSCKSLSQNIVMQNYLNESATDTGMDCHYDCNGPANQYVNETLLKRRRKMLSETQLVKSSGCERKNVDQPECCNVPKMNPKCVSAMETQCRYYYPERSSVVTNDFKLNYSTIDAKDYRNMLNKIMRWTIK